MLGLHNILLIAPTPSSYYQLQQQQQQPQPHFPSGITDDQCNISSNQEPWPLTLKKYPQQESIFARQVVHNQDTENSNSSTRACRDCGNRAKKECEFRRCRTCCKSRGYDCATHVKSTWVPASRRRERHAGGGGSSGSSSGGAGACGGKRPRENVTTPSNSTSNNNAAASFSLDTGSSYQDASFKQSLPGQIRAPAVFRCIRVSAVNGTGDAEIAYQAMVNISGHVFKGFLYDQGIDEKNVFPCISKVQSTGRNRDSSSPIVNTQDAYAASGSQRLLEGNE